MKAKMLTATAYPPPPPPPQSSPKKDSRKLIVVALLLVIIIVSAGVLFYLATRPSSTGSPTPTPTGTATPTPTGTGATPTPIGTATPTPTPSGGGANVAGASSLQYTVSVTNSSGASLGTWTYYAKNAGTSNLMIRIEFADPSDGNFVYIINGALQQAWMESGGEWTDLSSAFASQWSSWNSTFAGYQNQLAGWAGVGDYTYTAGGDTVRIYDVAVNPSLADSLFQHS